MDVTYLLVAIISLVSGLIGSVFGYVAGRQSE